MISISIQEQANLYNMRTGKERRAGSDSGA
jgi:hypothetical protein